jgi:Mn2+/Fe2+ NRAMP family transporter
MLQIKGVLLVAGKPQIESSARMDMPPKLWTRVATSLIVGCSRSRRSLFVIAGAVCFGGIATLRVVRSVELTRLQKAAQIVLTWIIPLIAAIIVMILTGREYMRRRHGIGDSSQRRSKW